jgi:putative transcription factor
MFVVCTSFPSSDFFTYPRIFIFTSKRKMPARAAESGQDLKPQVFHFGPRPTSANAPPKKMNEQQANRAVQQGQGIAVVKKEHVNFNHNHAGPGANAKRLDEDHESTKVKLIDRNISIMIQRVRQQQNLKQEELAHKICERVSIVTEYENGKAVPNEQILVKIEKALGVHLRGAKLGEPMEAKKPQPKPAPKKA